MRPTDREGIVSTPRFPLRITTSDREEELAENREELAMALEWFDSDRSDGTVQVVDAEGRHVRVKVEALRVETLELDGVDVPQNS